MFEFATVHEFAPLPPSFLPPSFPPSLPPSGIVHNYVYALGQPANMEVYMLNVWGVCGCAYEGQLLEEKVPLKNLYRLFG